MAETTTTEVAITASDGCVLSGTLAVPHTGRVRSAALLLSGSGPLDRDSNIEGQILGISWALAETLGKEGVASLRYDKRGVGRSGGNYAGSGFQLEISDAIAAREYLRNVAGVDSSRVGVVGHSAGATIALQMAAADTSVAFAVLLAAAASSGREVMEWQSDRIAATLPGPDWLLGRWFRRRQRRDRERLLGSTDDMIWMHRQETPARWLREYMAYDPGPDLAAIQCPVLAITGGKDLQVNPADLVVIAEAVQGSCSTEAPADLTHVLRCDSSRPKLSSYPDLIARPVDADVLRRVASWITETDGCPNPPAS